MLNPPRAIVIGAALIAAAIVGAQFVPRYQALQRDGLTLRLDTITGEIQVCTAIKEGVDGYRVICSETLR